MKKLQVNITEEDYKLLKENIRLARYLGVVDSPTISKYIRRLLHAHAGKLKEVEMRRRDEMDNLIEHEEK